MDSLLSIVQMPRGIPVGTLAIGQSGAVNAGLLAVAILANSRPDLREKTEEVPGGSDREGHGGRADVSGTHELAVASAMNDQTVTDGSAT